MKVTIKGKEYTIREDMPGVFQFVELDHLGRVLSIADDWEPEDVEPALEAYRDSPDHMAQLLVDYGYTAFRMTDTHTMFKKLFLRTIKMAMVSNRKSDGSTSWAAWDEVSGHEPMTEFGTTASDLWKFLNPTVRKS